MSDGRTTRADGQPEGGPSAARGDGAPLQAVLISTYDLGRQPFGLASPAAWLRRAGAEVTCLDLAVEQLDEDAVRHADLIGIHLPMHTATRIAIELLPRLRALNPTAHVCGYGLYAPLNAERLAALGVDTLIGGEVEAELTALAARLADGEARRGNGQRPSDGRTVTIDDGRPSKYHSRDRTPAPGVHPMPAHEQPPDHVATVGTPNVSRTPDVRVSRARLDFITPARDGLPPLERYARLETGDGQRTVGYTEASRGCKHHCRHCPVVPVYGGRFRVVPHDVVLADIEQQVAAGAKHITFGDPDFLNGIGHALPLVRTLHAAFPDLTYDVTVKIEHLLAHAADLATLRDTGCVLVTSAVESIDDDVLAKLDKGHTRADFVRAVALCRAAGLALNPTFVAFHPWLSLEDYRALLELLDALDLVPNVAPIQLTIRLLIPRRSKLLELDEVQQLVEPFDPDQLVYPWAHPDPRVDALQAELETLVAEATADGSSRPEIFAAVSARACDALGVAPHPQPRPDGWLRRAPIPYLTEPWYC